MREIIEPMSKEYFDEMKARVEAAGYTVVNKWRKGTKTIKLGDIVLSEEQK